MTLLNSDENPRGGERKTEAKRRQREEFPEETLKPCFLA